MSGRRPLDLVTVVYPPGCREVTDDLGSDELIRRLKTLAHTFQSYSQAEEESTYVEYTPLAIHLADEIFLNHESKDVQLLVGCCVADILRIFAPEAPYKDTHQIKTIFFFLIKQLGGLKDPKDPAFKRYFYLLENLAFVKSFNMCFDLEDCSEIFCALFTLLFKIVNDEHSGKVKNFMLDVLCPLITDADFVSKELLDIILRNIVEPAKSRQKNAYNLAKDLIIKTSSTLEPYIQQFFNQALILGKVEEKLTVSRKVYDLIYELNNISPSVLLAVLPQLEFKLKSTDEAERMGSVSLLASMFSEKSSRLALNHPQLWRAFLGRYNDVSVAIRIKCVQYTMHFLLNHPELHEDIIETLKSRQHDPEETVRYEVVMAIVSAVKKDFSVVSDSEDLLNFVKERTMDKKFKIRKEAVTGLALIYNETIMEPINIPAATKNAVNWIKDKILHGYYMPGIEDRLLVERLLNTKLVPYSLDSSERMKMLYKLFGSIDENASKAFIEVQKHQQQVRRGMAEFVALHRTVGSDKRNRDITYRVHIISKYLPEPVKAQEFIKKLSVHLVSDETMLNLFEKIVDPDISCKECIEHVNKILKKLGSPIMTNLYYGTVKQLLERISSLMVDRDAIQHLTIYVKEALDGGPILEELGLDIHTAGERGLRLLFVLSFVFPSHFLYEDLIVNLLSFLNIDSDTIAPLVLSILTFIGKHRPIVELFPNLHDVLVRICKEYIRTGSPKQAKQAVKCLYMNITTNQDAVFAEVLEVVKSNLIPTKGQLYRTAIVALGHVAFHVPEKFPIQIKNLVSRKIVKELLMKDTTEPRTGSTELWEEENNLPLETLCKMEGMKMMARWLLGLKDDTISAQKTFRMLNAIIENKGDLLESKAAAPSERAWLRYAAGSAMLKICEQKGVGDEYNVEQFYTLSKLMIDDVPQVREKFYIKLHKGLGRGIPNKCLPLDFMGLYALASFESDKKLKIMAKQFMTGDILKRRDYIKTYMVSGVNNCGSDKNVLLTNVMPDFMLVFVVPVLTHFEKFTRYDDVDMLKQLQNALWFILEPLMQKNENYSFGFYKTLIESMKNHKDNLHPEDDAVNYKMWAICDLALGLIISRTNSYELKEFPTEPKISSMYFKAIDDPNWINTNSYLPPQLQHKAPKKAGPEIAFNFIPNSFQRKQFSSSDKGNNKEDSMVVMIKEEKGDSDSLDESSDSKSRKRDLDDENGLRTEEEPKAKKKADETSVSTNVPKHSRRVSKSDAGSEENEPPSDETASGRPRRSTRT